MPYIGTRGAGSEHETLVTAAGLTFAALLPSLPAAFKTSAGAKVSVANIFTLRSRAAAFLGPLFNAWWGLRQPPPSSLFKNRFS
jgi:hypothetical protein